MCACSRNHYTVSNNHQGRGFTAFLNMLPKLVSRTAKVMLLYSSIVKAMNLPTFSYTSMTSSSPLHYFPGMVVRRDTKGLFLSQHNYVADILHRANMSNCKRVTTPVDTSAKLHAAVGPPVADPSLYRSLAGALQYLTFTRPDIAYAVQQICLYMHDPREPHFTAMKRILRYLKGTISEGLHITRSNTTTLTAYTDADWAGCPNTRRSTSGFAVFLGNNLIS
ncbi:PREDICTED: uncharacterized protein LOC109133362 [Camelina sativa]|uniref:Uncharacterized protein LOC109133362 n=1 Tax=Camelina sativa TaxID=90675 RepID=A0ABM1RSG0_CAMSA|nr:PREDICTED: uncharacterized protein LOC109133362 [Camelina sativa]